MNETYETPPDHEVERFARGVGARLRAVRQARSLSLEDVQRASGGKWSASAIGAYERGFRNLSVPRLKELSAFFAVPMGALLGEANGNAAALDGVEVDLDRLAVSSTATPARRYLRSVARSRGDTDRHRVALRPEDVSVLTALLQMDSSALADRLREWGAIRSQ
jgi:transcriptional regulator with XRE-family HTH domain